MDTDFVFYFEKIKHLHIYNLHDTSHPETLQILFSPETDTVASSQ